MERDYRNRTDEIEARVAEAEAAREVGGEAPENVRPIPRGDARDLLKGILAERAEVFRKLAR